MSAKIDKLKALAYKKWCHTNMWAQTSMDGTQWAVIVKVTDSTTIACGGQTEAEAWHAAILMVDGKA